MSGRGRLTLCAFGATVLSAGALLPLVRTNTWLLQAAFFAAILSGVGAAARRVPLARPLTVLVQAVAGLLLLTVAFARGHAPLGLLPTPGVFHEFGRLLNAGGEDVGKYAIPAPPTDGIKLMLVGGVLVIGLVVDAIAVTFRSAAPAGLPLLALYSVAAGLSGGAGGTLWFLLAAVGYLLLLLAEGRDRLSQWGRVFGGGPRTAGPGRAGRDRENGHALAPARTGRRIGAVALGIALVVPAALPSLDGGLLASAGGGAGTGSGGGGTISAVNPLVSLQDNLNQPENREALRYRTNAKNTQDLYLRIMALDKFDGTTWRFSQRSVEDVPGDLPVPPGLDSGVSTTTITSNISAAPWYRQNYLPMPYPATKVKIGGRWRFEPVGRTLVGDKGQSTEKAQYTVTSLQVDPTREQLASAPQAPAALRREYTQVPGNLPALVKRTALEVTSGAANDYERAVKLQDWFAQDGGFSYDTNVDSGTGVEAITRFLRDKRGFCVHFSFTMAAMARTLGIPARVAVGFTPGNLLSDGSMSVGLRDAHAWPELYFQGVGWTRFEPTPSRGSVPAYTRQDTPGSGPADVQQPESTASAAPSAAPSASAGCDARAARTGDCGAAAQGAQPPADSGSSPWTVTVITLSVLGLLLLLFLLSLPLLWRALTRSRHLNAGGPPPGGPGSRATAAQGADGGTGKDRESPQAAADLTARTMGVWREIADTAWDHGIPPDDSLTPRKSAARIVRLGRLEGPSAEALHRLAGSVEQVLYAPRPRPGADLAADAREIRKALRSAAGRRTRLRALLLPRSTVRVIWALSERWAGFTERWGVHRLELDRWSGALRRRPSRQRG